MSVPLRSTLMHGLDDLGKNKLRNTNLRPDSPEGETEGKEEIYGFALFTDPFYEFISSCVFTEAGLMQRAERYQRHHPSIFGPDASLARISEGLRWNPADSPYVEYREIEDFSPLLDLLGDLWSEIDRDNEEQVYAMTDSLEGICIASLVEIRKSDFPESIALLVVQGDQGFEERYALAELFNPPQILTRLRSDWNWAFSEEELARHRMKLSARRKSMEGNA